MDNFLKFIGFQMERTTPELVEGRFVVNDRSCQPYLVLHGGVSALIAQSLAGIGANVASGSERVAGVELNINHLRAAPVGMEVFASAKPVYVGKKVHVWDVTLSKVDSSTELGVQEKKISYVLAISRVTLAVGLNPETTELFDVKSTSRL
eukprot:c26620_g3_i3 orf=414-863(+)